MSSGAFGNLLVLALPLLLIVFLVTVQRRRKRDIQQFQASIGVGDEVCTTSGLFGRIIALDNSVASLEVSPGVTLRFDRRAIGTKNPTTPTGTGK